MFLAFRQATSDDKKFQILGRILKIDLANRILITYFMGARLQ
jgi:hypothetical protein